MSTTPRPLMGTSNILQLQDNGYKSTVSAISEIIDNSIQANSKNVDVILVRNVSNTSTEFVEEILVLDDGDGMNKDTFDKALQMSSGTRNNAKAGLGKYGQGLPNASISQTRRVEVYTKQDNSIFYNYIDLQEIYNSGVAVLPNIEEVNQIDIPLFKEGLLNIKEKGTVVRWVKPNRVKPKTAKTLADHIEKIAGRTYRYFIQGFTDKDGKEYQCNINIYVYDYNGKIYSLNDFLSKLKIKAFDPMFLMKNTQIGPNPTSLLYGEPAIKKFSVEYDDNIVDSTVELRVSFCPRSERDKHGRNAGSTEFGMVYLKRNLPGTSGYNNISIIRAGREIDSGSFGFIADVSDPRNRWWSAEIILEPSLDSIVGIDNKKQQAANIHFVDSNDGEDGDVSEILKWISNFLSQNILAAKNVIKKEDVVDDNDKEKEKRKKLPPGAESEEGTPPVKDYDATKEEEERIRKEFFDWIKKRYPELPDEEIWKMVDYALSIRDYHFFIKSDLGDTALFDYSVIGNKVLIEINYHHAFYDKFIRHFVENGDITSERAVRLLIGSMVNAEIQLQTNEKSLISDRRKIKNRMAETLEDYINDLYS